MSQQDAVEEFLRLWQQEESPDVDAFLGRCLPFSPVQLSAILCIDQHERWQAGQRVSAEDYLQRHPELNADSGAAVDLIYQEFLIRERLGERPTAAEYLRRFPAHASELRMQIEFHQAVQPSTGEVHQEASEQDTQTRHDHTASGAVDRLALVPAPSAAGSESEVAALLRKRLLVIVALLSVALPVHGGFVLALTAYIVPFFAVLFAVILGLGVLLWSKTQLSLHQLRCVEIAIFVPTALLSAGFQSSFLYQGGLAWAVQSDWQGVTVLGRSLSLTWFGLIMMYGILIPNTWRRCAAACGLIGLCPVLQILLLVALLPGLEPRLLAHFLIQMAFIMAAGSALAIYGSHRIEVLRQKSHEARRLGPYQLRRLLGSGGMGDVYLAEHVLLRRPCAIKIIRPERAADPCDLKRFEREVQVTGTLTHPNTVQVFDYGHADDGTFYYAMEYLPGLNLQELIEVDEPLPAGRAIHLLRQVCLALHEAHTVGLIHRDIKPSNIIVGQRGAVPDVVKLLDFGLVQAPRRPDEANLTQENYVAGTPAYMSPEQAAGTVELDPRSDIYSLGAVAYFLLTGRPPFTDPSPVKVLAAHLHEQPARLTEHRSDVPEDLQTLVLRCLAKDPADRFPDAKSLEQALADSVCGDDWNEAKAAAWWRSRS
jgi:serine/threonine-protein kinase